LQKHKETLVGCDRAALHKKKTCQGGVKTLSGGTAGERASCHWADMKRTDFTTGTDLSRFPGGLSATGKRKTKCGENGAEMWISGNQGFKGEKGKNRFLDKKH